MSNETLPAERAETLEEATRSRLELKYVGWDDSWEEFVEHIEEHGTDLEIQIIQSTPAEFRAGAVQRRHEKLSRLRRWRDNRMAKWLDRLDQLTDAEKPVVLRKGKSQSVEMVPDNAMRLAALKVVLGLELQPKDSNLPSRPGMPEEPSVPLESLEALQELNGPKLSERRQTLGQSFRTGVEGNRAAND